MARPGAVRVTATWTGDIDDRCQRKIDTMAGKTLSVLEQLGAEGVSIARPLAPVLSGAYRGAIHFRRDVVGKRMGVNVLSGAPHAHLVESGRKPGKIPLAADLTVKLSVSRSDAYPIARRIGTKGTKGAKVMARTRKAMKGRLASESHQLAAWLNDLDAS